MEFLKANSKIRVKLTRETHEILFIARHSSVLGKVRELVGEIKYAFDVWGDVSLPLQFALRQTTFNSTTIPIIHISG